jgi:hypothetical protein
MGRCDFADCCNYRCKPGIEDCRLPYSNYNGREHYIGKRRIREGNTRKKGSKPEALRRKETCEGIRFRSRRKLVFTVVSFKTGECIILVKGAYGVKEKSWSLARR